MSSLNSITDGVSLDSLTTVQLREVQSLLNQHGYSLAVDGILGPLTAKAFREFKESKYLGYPDLIGATTVEVLKQVPKNPQYNFSTQNGTIDAIKQECKKKGLPLKPQIAYVLATAQWETANTFKPVKEAYWLSEEWRRKNLRYFPFYGRGLVQITWKSNYQKYSDILGVDLVNNPDKVLEPNISLFILVHGCKNGTFTGMKIEDYINSNRTDFYNARRVINGIDKAQEIANIAKEWMRKI